MCGINGVISKRTIENLEYRIHRMNKSLVHRGPDNGGVLCNEKGTIGLAHRRLSIIDLDNRAAQPMVSASGRWTIVYNGEIYNYKELKDSYNYLYKTTSDTEVILSYVEMHGIEDFLKKSNGMFAIAIYDNVDDKLYLCRDRLGIKPLFYYIDDTVVIFSSEIKGILNSGLVSAHLDKESIDDYLAYRYVREPYTFFEGIRQVESGTYICIDSGLDIDVIRYWDIPDEFNMDTEFDEEIIAEKFNNILEETVLKQTVADVPLGTYLSGGVDSGILTAIVASNSNKRVNTYTIGFPELNEFEYSDMTAQRYNTVHHKIEISSEQYFENLKEIISYKDAPLGVPNEIPLALMSKELKKKITVVLSGEGADELLGGYGRIFRSPFEYSNEGVKESFYDYFIKKYEYVPRELRDEFLCSKNTRRTIYDDKIKKSFQNNCNEYNVFKFFHKYHVKGLLQRVDTTTMLASVEARVPYLDHELIEYVYREVPYDLKLRWISDDKRNKAKKMSANEFSEVNDVPKYLLKKVAYNYISPEIIERKKMGFPVPLNMWNQAIVSMVNDKLNNAKWLKIKDVNKLVNACKSYHNGEQLLWMFLNVQLFVEMYFDKDWRY